MVWTGGVGLTQVPLDELKKLLAYLHRGEVTFPLTISEATRIGMQARMPDLELLRGLDATAVRAVLVAVIAERMARQREVNGRD